MFQSLEPLVSVIVIAYNHELYVEQLLKSIVEQTYNNIELIFIDDGSQDLTYEKAYEFIYKNKMRFVRIEVIKKENEGITKTLNKGVLLAKGKYVKPIASDDYMFSDAIFKMVQFMEKHEEYGMVYTDGYDMESEQLSKYEINGRWKKKFSDNMQFASGDLFDFMVSNVFLMPTPTVFIRSSCYEKIGLYDENLLCEDPDFFLRISREYKIGCIPEILVIHRMHGNNSGKNSNIIEPTVNSMIKKYESFPFDNIEQKHKLMETLYRAIGLVNTNIVMERITNKEIIGWGTGSSYKKSQKLNKLSFKYLIDSDVNKQGKMIDDYKVFPPAKLLEENKDDIFVVVYSQFYQEIYKWLEDHGFVYKIHFY